MDDLEDDEGDERKEDHKEILDSYELGVFEVDDGVQIYKDRVLHEHK